MTSPNSFNVELFLLTCQISHSVLKIIKECKNYNTELWVNSILFVKSVWTKSQSVTMQMKATEQCYAVQGGSNIEYTDIFKRDHSNESVQHYFPLDLLAFQYFWKLKFRVHLFFPVFWS